MRRLAVLRPEPGATATVERARRLGLDAFAVPLFEVEPVEWHSPDAARFDALLLTSANAVRHGGEGLRKLRTLPVHAVGDATARAAREAGLDVVTTGDGGVERLLQSLAPDLKLLHLCGEDRAIPADAQAITPIAVYRSVEKGDPDPIPDNCVALVHSPRAGRRLAELVQHRDGIAIAAISPQAAEAVGSGWQSVGFADVPTDDALLALAARLCNKPVAG